ncbi:F-box and leucine-rich repeat protein 13-like [Chironomus tepperi]|uniref:F-box and leucine-rich repeat protein 13-like n=1 Tax=Chironomus tepperi TaxID=113505 RepID=UPI00391F56C7
MKILWYREFEATFEYVHSPIPCLDYLPMEILIMIFSYLNPSDMLCIGLTCKRFMDALQYHKFSNYWILSFCERQRIVPAVAMYSAQLDDISSDDFWEFYGHNLHEVQFLSGLLRKEEFANVMKYTKNVRSIKIEANSMFKNWTINKCGYDPLRRILLYHCRHFGLARNSFLSPDIFEYLMMTVPCVTSIDLSNCLSIMNPPERNKFLDHVLAYITANAERIKSLNFANTPTDDLFLDRLGRIENLKLKELHLTFMGSTKNPIFGIPILIASQNELEKFDLTASPCANDLIVRMICGCMLNMKVLLLKKCHNLTDHGVKELNKLKHLKSLEISDCDYVTDVGVMEGVLSGDPKDKMEELRLSVMTNLSENIIFRMSYFFPNLKVLDLGGVSNAVTDLSIQLIFRHMKYLRFLNVESCCKLTDFGFTGLESTYAKRMHSLRNLKGLQVLRANGLYKLTDFTLEDAFVLKELKELYFARCNFTIKGITSLAENCPSLEVLDMSECKSIDDECVAIIAKNLPRLKTLKFNNCDKITEKSMEIITDHCADLRNLFIRNCKLNFDPSDNLAYMRALRKVVS